MSSLSVSPAGGEAGTRRAHIPADSSAVTQRQEETTAPQNARCTTTCGPPACPRSRLRGCGGCRPRHGALPVGPLLSRERRRQVAAALQAAPALRPGRPFPRGRRCLPAPLWPYLRERAGRRPAAAPAAPAAAACRPCRSRGQAALPRRGRRWGRGATLRSGEERHSPGPCSPPAVPGRPPPSCALSRPPQSAAPAPARPAPGAPAWDGRRGKAFPQPAAPFSAGCASGGTCPRGGYSCCRPSPAGHRLCLHGLPVAWEAALRYPKPSPLLSGASPSLRVFPCCP